MMKYLSKYEVVKSSEEGKNLVYVPYTDHAKVNKYLKKNNHPFSLRFNHDYSLAIYTV